MLGAPRPRMETPQDLEEFYRSLGWKPPEEERNAIPPPAVEDKARKPRWDLLRYKALELLAEIMAAGEGKHADTHGWAKKSEDSHFASMMRHLVASRTGDKIDPEFGKPHLAHAMCRLMFLLAMEIGDVPCSENTSKGR